MGSDIWAWFVSLRAATVAAGRSTPMLSVITARVKDYGYRLPESNASEDIRRYRWQGRERFCSVEEARRLGSVLKQHEPRFPT